MQRAAGRVENARLAMKIEEAETLAKSFCFRVRFVIAGEDPEARGERLQDFAAAVEAAAEIREVAGGDVNIRGLGDDALEGAQVTVNVAEEEDAGHFPPGALGGLALLRGGENRFMRRRKDGSCCQPSSTRFPELSKTTR